MVNSYYPDSMIQTSTTLRRKKVERERKVEREILCFHSDYFLSPGLSNHFSINIDREDHALLSRVFDREDDALALCENMGEMCTRAFGVKNCGMPV